MKTTTFGREPFAFAAPFAAALRPVRPCRRGARGDVARRALRRRVPAGQGELRLHGVVEGNAPEGLLVVAAGAVLLELAPVRVLVARGAGPRLQPDLRRRLLVAGGAWNLGVPAPEREGRLAVVDLHRPEGRRLVARGAVRSERLLVRVLVAVGAGRELHAAEDAVGVALGAGHLRVGTGQRVFRLPVVERPARFLESDGRRVTGDARRPEGSLVRVGVAGDARGRELQEGARLVARRALLRERRVLAVEREAGFLRVLEALRLERTQLPVAPRVLGVAGGALVLHVPVDALLLRDPGADVLVAREAAVRRDLVSLLVALLAVLQPVELRVGGGKRTGRHEVAQLRSGRSREEESRRGGQREAFHRPPTA